jgi:hypothetical protein
VRIVGALYPLATVLVIMGTANHFILDAVAGAAVLGVGLVAQYLMSGRSAFEPAPLRAPDDSGDRDAVAPAAPQPSPVVLADAQTSELSQTLRE